PTLTPYRPPSTPPISPPSLSLKLQPPPRSTPFPYTTLFRSHQLRAQTHPVDRGTGPDRARNRHHRRHRRRHDLHMDSDHHHRARDRKSTRLNSSHVKNSYAVFCLKKKKKIVDLTTAYNDDHP